jgi:hypothetical protein
MYFDYQSRLPKRKKTWKIARNTTIFNGDYKKWNIVVNTNKTKVEIVDSYVYLGIILHYNGKLYLCYSNVFKKINNV